jgi:hypothetical protein
MNSIESLKLDFNSQIEELGNIQNEKMFDEFIYVGSGDLNGNQGLFHDTGEGSVE